MQQFSTRTSKSEILTKCHLWSRFKTFERPEHDVFFYFHEIVRVLPMNAYLATATIPIIKQFYERKLLFFIIHGVISNDSLSSGWFPAITIHCKSTCVGGTFKVFTKVWYLYYLLYKDLLPENAKPATELESGFENNLSIQSCLEFVLT